MRHLGLIERIGLPVLIPQICIKSGQLFWHSFDFR